MKITLKLEEIIKEEAKDMLYYKMGDIIRKARDTYDKEEQKWVDDIAKKITIKVLEAIKLRKETK